MNFTNSVSSPTSSSSLSLLGACVYELPSLANRGLGYVRMCECVSVFVYVHNLVGDEKSPTSNFMMKWTV